MKKAKLFGILSIIAVIIAIGVAVLIVKLLEKFESPPTKSAAALNGTVVSQNFGSIIPIAPLSDKSNAALPKLNELAPNPVPQTFGDYSSTLGPITTGGPSVEDNSSNSPSAGVESSTLHSSPSVEDHASPLNKIPSVKADSGPESIIPTHVNPSANDFLESPQFNETNVALTHVLNAYQKCYTTSEKSSFIINQLLGLFSPDIAPFRASKSDFRSFLSIHTDVKLLGTNDSVLSYYSGITKDQCYDKLPCLVFLHTAELILSRPFEDGK